MTKVITYGTYDHLHHGHIRLLERAKSLGDYLIVGVTADGFDMARGKINVQQSLLERIEAVRRTGLADQIIVEEYEGQKIDDIRKYGIDIFTVGSDWIGKFDYLKEFCKVVYLDRTLGISSTDIRSSKSELKLGLVGETPMLTKFKDECKYVNGIKVVGAFSASFEYLDDELQQLCKGISSIEDIISISDALYIVSNPSLHYMQCKKALEAGVHVICESPITLREDEYDELSRIAYQKALILMDGLKTAYSLAYNRLILLVKSGIIGEIISVDTTCTSLVDFDKYGYNLPPYIWNSITGWGPTALLPILDILGTDYKRLHLASRYLESDSNFDIFTKGSLVYSSSVASFKVGKGVKSEGDMVISGTKGYIYVPSPWWKTDYFEVRYENASNNKRYFFQLEGEGIRYEILSFLHQIEGISSANRISSDISRCIIRAIQTNPEILLPNIHLS